METPAEYLQLVFLATTVTPGWGVGWAFTNTTVPRPRAMVPTAGPPRLRLAVIASQNR